MYISAAKLIEQVHQSPNKERYEEREGGKLYYSTCTAGIMPYTLTTCSIIPVFLAFFFPLFLLFSGPMREKQNWLGWVTMVTWLPWLNNKSPSSTAQVPDALSLPLPFSFPTTWVTRPFDSSIFLDVVRGDLRSRVNLPSSLPSTTTTLSCSMEKPCIKVYLS